MPGRFVLVFEGGARSGERIVLTGDRITIGRKPENSVAIADASVSGAHCELRLAGGAWVLKDLASTNGTQFRGAKILEAKLQPGDQFTVGTVGLRLEAEDDAEEISLEEPAEGGTGKPDLGALDLVDDGFEETPAPAKPLPATAPASAAAGAARTAAPRGAELQAGEAVATTAMVERAREKATAEAKRGRKATIAALVVAVAMAGVAAFYYFRAESGGGRRVAAVKVVEGNRLAQPSFEIDAEGAATGGAWDTQDGSPFGFSTVTRGGRSGARALEAHFDAPGFARAAARAVPVEPGQRLRFAAFAKIAGAKTGAAVQAVFRSAKEGARPIVRVGGAAYGSTEGYTRLEGTALAPAGCREVQVWLVAFGAEGAVDFDDAELVIGASSGDEPAAPVKRLEIEFEGDPLDGRVRKIDRTLVDAIGPVVVDATGARSPGWTLAGRVGDAITVFAPDGPIGTVALKLEPADTQVVYRWRFAAAKAGSMPLACVLDRAFAPEFLVRGGKSTGRYAGEFQDAACAALVVGDPRDRLRLTFDPPSAVKASLVEAGMRVEIGAAGELAMTVQFAFEAEKRLAIELENEAQQLEGKGAFGEALALRARILEECPFDRALIERNEAERDKRLAVGQKSIAEAERIAREAEFFRIPDGFRRARTEAQSLAKAYAGSPVAERAKAILETVDAQIATVEAERGENVAQQLKAIADACAERKLETLAAYFRDYLKKYYPNTAAARPSGG